MADFAEDVILSKAEALEKRADVESRIDWLYNNLHGCDWCCGGGDVELEALEKEVDRINQWLRDNGHEGEV